MIEHALIDGDIVAYRCAAVTENDDEAMAIWQSSEMVRRILHETNTMQHSVFLTGSNNFRYDVYPEYKAHRKDMPRPRHLQAVRANLVSEWGATVTDGIEADDALGIKQCAMDGNSIICTIDKDLLMIPGQHYNFVNQEFRIVSPLQGMRHFYYQLIMGDRADWIPGYDGKMRQKVPKFLEQRVSYLEECMTERDMYDHVAEMYSGGLGEEQMHINGKVLWIMRKEDDYWQSPPANLSSALTMEEAGQSDDTIRL